MIRLEDARFDDLAVFVVVAKLASFIAAAKTLAMPTTTVSRCVARLEMHLGVQLLRRTSRRVAVTDEGRQLLLAAEPHIEGVREALASLVDRKTEPTGILRVTAPAYTGSTRVARSLAAFAVAHPKVTIELDASNVMHDLLRDGYDFAIRVGGDVTPDFVARRLWRGHFGLFASPAFIKSTLKGRTSVTRRAIEDGSCIVLRTPTTWRFRDSNGRLLEVRPRARFAVNDPRAAVAIASRGLGVALVPLDAAAGEASLVRLRTEFGEPEPVDLFVVYPTRRLLPARVRIAIDWLMEDARNDFTSERMAGDVPHSTDQ